MKAPVALVLAISAIANAQNQRYPDCINGLLARNDVCNTALSPPERAAALVAAMTIDEKLQNIVS